MKIHNFSCRQKGIALLLAMVMLLAVSGLIIKLTSDVGMDIGIGRNLRLKEDSLNWADNGLEMAEEMVNFAIDTRGEDANGSQSVDFGDGVYSVSVTSTLFNGNGTVSIVKNGNTLSSIGVGYLGVRTAEGGSLIIAAGYEGAGKGYGAGSSALVLYSMNANGLGRAGSGNINVYDVYRFVSSGR